MIDAYLYRSQGNLDNMWYARSCRNDPWRKKNQKVQNNTHIKLTLSYFVHWVHKYMSAIADKYALQLKEHRPPCISLHKM